MSRQERIFQLALRVLGTSCLSATLFVFVPFEWMNSIHQQLGLGNLPDTPIVGYLARSTSAFYAMLGGLLWMLSFDVRRHRAVLRYLGLAIIVFGMALFGVGWQVGLPIWWRLWEGQIDCAFGIVILWLASRTGDSDPGRGG